MPIVVMTGLDKPASDKRTKQLIEQLPILKKPFKCDALEEVVAEHISHTVHRADPTEMIF